jgi:hypothetical protein
MDDLRFPMEHDDRLSWATLLADTTPLAALPIDQGQDWLLLLAHSCSP